MSELREKLRRLIVLHITSSGYTVDELADAAIALCMEEAAKVADETGSYDAIHIAAAIRALKGTP